MQTSLEDATLVLSCNGHSKRTGMLLISVPRYNSANASISLEVLTAASCMSHGSTCTNIQQKRSIAATSQSGKKYVDYNLREKRYHQYNMVDKSLRGSELVNQAQLQNDITVL